MELITRGAARLCLSCLSLLLLCQLTSAAPAEKHLATNRIRDSEDYEKSWSTLSYITSKAMGAFFKIASFVYEWMPDFLKPSRPSFRFRRNGTGFKIDDFD